MTGDEDLAIEKPIERNAPKFDNVMKLAILNAPIITSFGNYTYYPIPLESAKILVNAMEISSFVGHESTAQLISEILERPIGFSRKELKQRTGQMALVFKLKKRASEGTVLDRKMLDEIGYEFGILYRTK